MRRYGVARATLTAVLVATLTLCGVVQAASDGLAHEAAAPGSLPRTFSRSFGIAVYRAMERASNATFVEMSLANAALQDGRPDLAERYALRMSRSPWRDEALARVADARGDRTLAYEYYFAAADVDVLQARIAAMRDAPEALERERVLTAWLEQLRIHPDAVAQGYWTQGLLYARMGDGTRAQAGYERALAQSPLNLTYLLSAANQSIDDRSPARARALFSRALSTIDPKSADALAGLGIVALRGGDRTQAQAYAARAAAVDPNSAELQWLRRELR